SQRSGPSPISSTTSSPGLSPGRSSGGTPPRRPASWNCSSGATCSTSASTARWSARRWGCSCTPSCSAWPDGGRLGGSWLLRGGLERPRSAWTWLSGQLIRGDVVRIGDDYPVDVDAGMSLEHVHDRIPVEQVEIVKAEKEMRVIRDDRIQLRFGREPLLDVDAVPDDKA